MTAPPYTTHYGGIKTAEKRRWVIGRPPSARKKFPSTRHVAAPEAVLESLRLALSIYDLLFTGINELTHEETTNHAEGISRCTFRPRSGREWKLATDC